MRDLRVKMGSFKTQYISQRIFHIQRFKFFPHRICNILHGDLSYNFIPNAQDNDIFWNYPPSQSSLLQLRMQASLPHPSMLK